MEEILQKLALCVEKGKVNLASPYPPAMKGEPGANELCLQALESGIPPETILNEGLVLGMARIGEKYSSGKAFIPEMLIAAKAMSAALIHLKPFFQSGEVKRKGTLIIGTVSGDLHLSERTRTTRRWVWAPQRRCSPVAGSLFKWSR